MPSGMDDFSVQPILEQDRVGQFSQMIVVRQIISLLFCRAQFGHIDHGSDQSAVGLPIIFNKASFVKQNIALFTVGSSHGSLNDNIAAIMKKFPVFLGINLQDPP